jgi:hypothetical protein
VANIGEPAKYSSRWPDSGMVRPRSAIIVITRDNGGVIGVYAVSLRRSSLSLSRLVAISRQRLQTCLLLNPFRKDFHFFTWRPRQHEPVSTVRGCRVTFVL